MLMPMVKRGTVTVDIAGTIQRMDDKLGFNSDKLGWIHTGELILSVLIRIDKLSCRWFKFFFPVGIGKISWTNKEIQGQIYSFLLLIIICN